MGIFSRTRDIIAANFNDMLDKADDPQKMIRMIILEMEETLVEVRASAARTIADQKEMHRHTVKLDKLQADWSEKAQLAISKDREDLARAALVEKKKAVDMSEQLKAALDSGEIVARPLAWGDVVLARLDMPTSYHLSVVVDDALQGVTDVVRGRDLFHATSVHRLLQALLGLPAPRYHHHALILGPDGRKLSKSLRDTSIRALREAGLGAEDIRRMVGLAGRPAPESFSRGRSARG